MIKVNISYADNDKGRKELENMIKDIERNYKIAYKSKEFRGRMESIHAVNYSQVYNNIYLRLEER